MGCFSCGASKSRKQNPEVKKPKQELVLQYPGCSVHLMEQGEALELAKGDFSVVLVRVPDENISLATIIKVGNDLQWPLTKDEPVVKLDSHHYLFSLPIHNGSDSLSYGVTFSDQQSDMRLLDKFLEENSCFSSTPVLKNQNKGIDWKEFAPRVEDYNNVLAKAIAGGTGQIVKGIFRCSNAYANQVHKGGEAMLTRDAKKKTDRSTNNGGTDASKKNTINNSLKLVRKVSMVTEKISKNVLDGVGIATGSVLIPIVRSQAGRSFLSMVPGEVLLASLDAFNKVFDAAEAAQRQALTATSGAASQTVTNRFGENAGEATQDVLATAGHVTGTAWNIFKIRKAINPTSSGVLTSAAATRRT